MHIEDLVLVQSQVKKHKFQDVYESPYRVIDVFDSYIEITRKGKRTKIHKKLVKKSQADHKNEPPMNNRIIALDNLDDEFINKINSIYNIKFLKY